jgi:hypothetical protein
MTDALYSQETGVRQTNFQMNYLDEVAETIRDDAIAQARKKLGAARPREDLDSLLNRLDFFDYFKYGLASGVVNVLTSYDPYVQAVYLYDPSANPDDETVGELLRDASVHLYVLVTAQTRELMALISAFDRALTASLKELPSSRFAQRDSILDVNLVTGEDVRCGAVLSGIFASPLKIWQRE